MPFGVRRKPIGNAGVAGAALLGTEKVGVRSALGVDGYLTPAQIADYLNTLAVGNIGVRVLFTLNADMNVTTDQVFTKIGTFTHWTHVSGGNLKAYSPSTSMTTAVGGVYSGAGKTGDILVSAAQAYTNLTASLTGFSLTSTALFQGLRSDTPILSLSTPQGAPATCKMLMVGVPLD